MTTHKFNSAVADGGDATKVQPSNWDALHYAPGDRIILGLTMPNAAGDVTNDIDFGAGMCMDSTDVSLIRCNALTKQLDAAWAVGSAAGGLDTGAIANTTYHCFAIKKDSNGVGDFLFSASATAPTMPAGYTYFRRIGSFKRIAGAIQLYTQDGNLFQLTTISQEALTSNPGTSAVLVVCAVPAGINVEADVAFQAQDATPDAVTWGLLTSPGQTDSTPATTMMSLLLFGAAASAAIPASATHSRRVRTDTSAQIRYRLSASTADHVVRIMTHGWVDRRGQ